MNESGENKAQVASMLNLRDLVSQVCARPAMYAGNDRWDVAAAFIDGGWWVLSQLQPEQYPRDEWIAFNRWLANKFDYPRNYGWMAVRNEFPDDEGAFAAFPLLYAEFRNQYAHARGNET